MKRNMTYNKTKNKSNVLRTCFYSVTYKSMRKEIPFVIQCSEIIMSIKYKTNRELMSYKDNMESSDVQAVE